MPAHPVPPQGQPGAARRGDAAGGVRDLSHLRGRVDARPRHLRRAVRDQALSGFPQPPQGQRSVRTEVMPDTGRPAAARTRRHRRAHGSCKLGTFTRPRWRDNVVCRTRAPGESPANPVGRNHHEEHPLRPAAGRPVRPDRQHHAAGLGDALRGQIGARAALAPRPWAARSAAVPTCRPWG